MRRTTNSNIAKCLAQVRGATLLERNVYALLGAGLKRIWVACQAHQSDVQREVATLDGLVRPGGSQVHALIEASPMGTIGAAGLLADRIDALACVNADNLCGLGMDRLLTHHVERGTDLTLAAHIHETELPYGALDVDGERVVAYREKPCLSTRVCSALSVLGKRPLALLAAKTSLPELTNLLLEQGGSVSVYEHSEPWIDVNDASELTRAAALVERHANLECWAPNPDKVVVGAVLCDGDRLLLEKRHDTPAGDEWDTPGGKVEVDESPREAILRELKEELDLHTDDAGRKVACFDAIGPHGALRRHHVFEVKACARDIRPSEGQVLEWFPLSDLPRNCARVVARSLACMVST